MSGSRLADRLAVAGRRIAGRAGSFAADPRARLLFDACRTGLQVVGPLSRGVLVYRLLARLATPRWLRTLVELAVLPVLIDRRLTRFIRTWFEAALRRVAGVRPPGGVAVVSAIGRDLAPAVATDAPPVEVSVPAAQPSEHLAVPADNRAGRRAAQRQEARAKKARPTH